MLFRSGGKHYGATESPTRPTPSFTERNATTNSSGSALGRLMTSAEESRTAGSATTGTLGNATENMSGQLSFEKVDYWAELCQIMEYAKKNVFSTLFICWGAQAGLYHNFGIKKQPLPSKLSGIYPHYASTWAEPLLRGFDDQFFVPQSRHTTILKSDIEKNSELSILAESEEAGVLLVKTKDNKQIFMTGHLEYDTATLAEEYWRDVSKNLLPIIPKNYFPNDDPNNTPRSKWRSTAHLFFSNWLNYYVYQETPFDVNRI